MITPLDPVIAQIIPLLPLRDPDDDDAAERPRCASRAGGVARGGPAAAGDERGRYQGEGRGRISRRAALPQRNGKSPTVVFFHGGGWVAGDLDTHDRQARLLAIETGAVVDLGRLSSSARGALSRRLRGCLRRHQRTSSPASPNSAATQRASASPATARAAIWRPRPRLPAATPASSSPAQLLVYPVTDVAGNFADAKENARFPSRAENAEGYFLSRAVMEWFCGHYLADARPRHRLARVAAAREKPRRSRAGGRHDGVVRSPARRGQGLRRRAHGRRRPDQIS